jgi:hypothetical protein
MDVQKEIAEHQECAVAIGVERAMPHNRPIHPILG